ncbi:adenine nucleotide alpha hydrolases-like protein [Fragilariopsis cylindrus CCMP1102]|uniref:Adenine nucleotide alpha hydrolases-like protein n=1 Tax=Fragilariopsis cylindrus CCMP1102 TaxID=635003 RepID=A0A1E7FQ90_9STRA|nr:adenine nucleotide alpha hydrolases-like protein [Fragilariopsis cylindrus CCMP1102]|eukprot:OEU20318.1 adenine nucleotide alpha hydrolases-like protein [Fragilariopsis cylindrus CCMP1102]
MMMFRRTGTTTNVLLVSSLLLLMLPIVCFSFSSSSLSSSVNVNTKKPTKTTILLAATDVTVTTQDNDSSIAVAESEVEVEVLPEVPVVVLSKKQLKRQEQNLPVNKLKYKLMKELRNVGKEYQMFEDGDHIMVCVSGGKDSAALLVLLMDLQQQLIPIGINFQLTAVHVDQKQPGYDGVPLVDWLNELGCEYEIIEEDTYSIVLDKTSPDKSFCTMCSRLRRGILYSKAIELQCNKLVLGHHADDSLETLVLNMLHVGQMKAMPARYTSQRGKLAVMRPLIKSFEKDIEEYAQLSKFPILPCNLCKNQSGLQRPQVKLLLATLDSFTPDAKKNWLLSLSNVVPSHLLDQQLRSNIGMNPITGEEEEGDINGDFLNKE